MSAILLSIVVLLAAAGIGVFIKRRPVKKPQSVGVLCEMRRYPVQYNAYNNLLTLFQVQIF